MYFKDVTVINGEDFQVRQHMHLCTEGKRISYLSDLPPENPKGPVVEGKNKVLLPGFVNTHCHAPMVLVRGYGEGLPLDQWLFDRMIPFEAQLTPEDMYWGTQLAMADMLASGTTSFSDMYFHLESMINAVDQVGIKANISQGTSTEIGSPVTYQEIEAYQIMEHLLEVTAALPHDRIRMDMGLHAEYTSDAALVSTVAEYAQEKDLIVHLHLSETQKEHEEAKARRGMTPTAWFQQNGIFQQPVIAAHGVWLEEEDIEILAQGQVTVAHCPSSNLKLGSGIANLVKIKEAGVGVSVGTDGAASNNNLNMLEEINLAAMVQKGARQDPLCLSTADVMEMGTRQGALAQGREDTGVIAVGNRADLVLVDMDKPHLQPVFDVLSNLLYAAQSSDIVMTMVDGQVLYSHGEYLTLDVEQAIFQGRRIARETLAKVKGSSL